jgi:hypothetical protein
MSDLYNTFTEHIPGFVDREPQTFQFRTLPELLVIPQVKRIAEATLFDHFSQIIEKQIKLMATYTDGSFWVVGYLTHPMRELPYWVDTEQRPL